MENIVAAGTSSRKSVVCRYFAASGTCFYGNDCQFMHSGGRSSMSPTFYQDFPSPQRSSSSRRAPTDHESSNGMQQQSYMRSLPVQQQQPAAVDSLIQKTQGLSLSTDSQLMGSHHSHTLFEVTFLTNFYSSYELRKSKVDCYCYLFVFMLLNVSFKLVS